jgi:putative effector of murein hydrolase
MKKNVSATMVAICVVIGLIGAGAITCIILSMVTGKVTPYLAMGLGLGAIGNAIGLVVNMKKKGQNNGSGKDRSIS